jgi:hypothetical protein
LCSFSLVITPCWGEWPHGQLCHWLFPTVPVQCRWHISSVKPGRLCQSVDLHSALAQCECHHPFGWAWMEHCTSVSPLWKEGKTWSFRECGMVLWNAFYVLDSVRDTKGLNFILASVASVMAASRKWSAYCLCRAFHNSNILAFI